MDSPTRGRTIHWDQKGDISSTRSGREQTHGKALHQQAAFTYLTLVKHITSFPREFPAGNGRHKFAGVRLWRSYATGLFKLGASAVPTV